MSCDSNDNDLKLAEDYKHLLSYIRPLIDQLDKSKDAQLCLLWLSKLQQCDIWERSYRNKILSELCKQVKAKCLKSPFNASPPSGPLQNVFCSDQKIVGWSVSEFSEDEVTTEAVTSSSHCSLNSFKNLSVHQTSIVPWEGDYVCNKVKNKGLVKPGKDLLDHSECFAIQKAYHERAQSDQMVIEKYQDIIKSLVSQQLKADVSPSKLKKLQTTYETKITELVHSLKKAQDENEILKQKLSNLVSGKEELNSQIENLRKQVYDLEADKKVLEEKYMQCEEEKLMTVTDLFGKLNEYEKKLKESEKRFKSLERKYNENHHRHEQEVQMEEKEKKYLNDIATLEKLLEEKSKEIHNLKEETTRQSNNYEQEVSKLKLELVGNLISAKDRRKIKSLKNKTKKLEKMRENMTVLFQSHLQQILAKKDFYIAALEMQLKMNTPEKDKGNLETEFENILHQKVSDLEAQYKKLLEDSEQQSLKRRQLDLQKIHNLEKQLLTFGEVIDDGEPISNTKTCSLTSVTFIKDDENPTKTF